MEILHLLPAALETLFSVYWLNACHFCTVDVNNKKKKKRTTQESCGNKGLFTLTWMWNMWLPKKENSKLYFLLLNQHPTCNDVTIKLLLSPGPNHTSPLLLHQLLPMFPVVPGDWLARFPWQRHLTFTVIEICGQVHLSIAVKSQMQLLLDQEKYSKLWIEPSSRAQRRAVLGYTKIYDHFCS